MKADLCIDQVSLLRGHRWPHYYQTEFFRFAPFIKCRLKKTRLFLAIKLDGVSEIRAHELL